MWSTLHPHHLLLWAKMPRYSPSQLHALGCLFACVLYGQWHEIHTLIEVYCQHKKLRPPQKKKFGRKKSGTWKMIGIQCRTKNSTVIMESVNFWIFVIPNTASKSHNGSFHLFWQLKILLQVRLINDAVIPVIL